MSVCTSRPSLALRFAHLRVFRDGVRDRVRVRVPVGQLELLGCGCRECVLTAAAPYDHHDAVDEAQVRYG